VINCNIGVKQGCPLFPTLFGIYIEKFEACLEEASCASINLDGIVIIFIPYVDDIVFMGTCPSDLDKKLRLLEDFYSTTSTTINIDKTKVMIIKSKNTTYVNFAYYNKNLEEEEVTSSKYLKFNLHHKLNWNYRIEKRINGAWKAYFCLENNCTLDGF